MQDKEGITAKAYLYRLEHCPLIKLLELWRVWPSRMKGLLACKALIPRRSFPVVQLQIQGSKLSLCISPCVIGHPSQSEQTNTTSCHGMSRKSDCCHCGWVRCVTLLPDSCLFLQEWMGGMPPLFSHLRYLLPLVNTTPSVHQTFPSAVPGIAVTRWCTAQTRATNTKPYYTLQQGGLI